MKIFKLMITLSLLFSRLAIGQFQESWLQVYDYERYDLLHDVYAPSTGGYIACGESSPTSGSRNNDYKMIVIRVDDNGNTIWHRDYEENEFYQQGNSLVETDNGDYIIAGTWKVGEPHEYSCAAWRINPDGELIWSHTFSGNWGLATIELKNGNYLICGSSSGPAFVTCLDGDGRQLWYHEYVIERHNLLFSMRETDGGVLVVGSTNANYNATENIAICLKIDPENEGEVIWSQQYSFDQSQTARSIVSAPQNGFIIAGQSLRQEEDVWISLSFFLRISSVGEVDWMHQYAESEQTNRCNCLQRLPIYDDDIIAVSSAHAGKFMYLNSACEMQWDVVYDDVDGFDIEKLVSVVPGQDGSFVGCGSGYSQGETYRDGFLMKFAPEVFEPQFIRWSPEDTVLTVLQNDSLQFSVFAQDEQGDSLIYRWLFAGDTVSRDTCYTRIFEDLGEEEIQCQVSDREHVVPITWHITVSDFFIRETSPDSLHLTARRGTTLPFTLDIACVEPDAPTVEWSTVNRDNEREYLGEADTTEVCFDLAGEWAVEAEAIWGEERESVRWAVDVRSAVWWWMPHEEAISVNQNERRDFSVFPFEPDSDSLSVAWWLDGDSLESITEALSLDFPDLGEHSLTTIVRDGVDADTISWQITVNDPGSVDGMNAIPVELALYPPAPNPFNSTTTIGYSLPSAGNVRVAVYDLAGREVARLVDGVKAAGTHEAVWQADGVSSGVYVVSLDAGGLMLREKVVLVK